MALALEIEYLRGVSCSSVGPDSEAADWPPQPDRVFSALVATWGAHGEPDDERRALEWLEACAVPLCASEGRDDRSCPTVFVPPNDPRSDRAKAAAGVLPAMRSRQPRRFPTARLHSAVVRHVWKEEPDATTFAALDRLARDTSYVGHSTSLTRCRFVLAATASDVKLQSPAYSVYAGRLNELRATYARFRDSGDKKDRPNPGALVLPHPEAQAPRGNKFSARWLILEHVDGEMPDIRAAAIVSRGIRAALMSGYAQGGQPIPVCISGHEADGSPTRSPHMAIVPLAFVGVAHADGSVMGFALVPPEQDDLFESETFRRVLRRLAGLDEQHGRRILEVKSPTGSAPDGSFGLKLSPTFEAPAARRSLSPGLYTRTARTFATATPIVLDRFLKERGAARLEEIAQQVAMACRNIGLPEPEAVFPDKHSALRGPPSAGTSGKSPAWMRWRLPPSLAGRPLTHAVVRFAEPVEGPLLLGAGRFAGMGLCRPLDEEDD